MALEVGCWLGGLLSKAVGVVGFAWLFLGYVTDAVVWYLGSVLDLNLSCAWNFGTGVLWRLSV